MKYIALYRKYRPKNFQNIVSQKIIIQTLKNAIKYQKIHHCYLFSGSKGVGKTTLAKVFTKAINCAYFLEKEDCCVNDNNENCCEFCSSIDQKQTLDFIEIDGASYSGVDDIRELKDKLFYKSNFLKYKVYIIDEVHVLSSNAFNALLKVLEEPSSNVIFILVTSEYHKIPENFFSRTQYFYLNNISSEDIQNKLKSIAQIENISISNEALYKISLYSKGSLRDALNLLDQVSSYKNNVIEEKDVLEILGIVSEEDIKKLFQFLFQNNMKNLISFLEQILSSDINYVLFLIDFVDFFHKQIIHCFKHNDDSFVFLSNLNYQTREKILQKLFELQNNLTLSQYKKNLLIIGFIQINNFLFAKIKGETINNLNENKIIFSGTQSNGKLEQKRFVENQSSAVIANMKENNVTTLKKAILLNIKNILLYHDIAAKDFICKGWKKLENYPIPKLSNIARLLYNSQVLMINSNKEILLSCRDEIEYRQLLKNDVRTKIKQILNTKKQLIKEYFVILHNDWEDIVKPVYLKFVKTNNKEDLDLSLFKTDFYERNSSLNIEQNQLTIVKLARYLFASDNLEIIN
ncbi:MAG: DNA polymerase III subunit gamma/tau [Phytoplasma sp.]|uniref:DNA polymerase III subunit gamma/tau n=1 Tax=Phytoplasma sp. TaxID=2155 RepID=UPI002B40A4C8|nr:DNA polymerase III subunit gamma/tau [Phytoplasma sp.]WRH06844.1 MAG: DNA polymerase III subunit gamma/tau [Phytoplasma sp.]